MGHKQNITKGFNATMPVAADDKGDQVQGSLVQNGRLNNSFMPQLFKSVPAFADAAACFAQTSSYFTHCFSNFKDCPSENYGLNRSSALASSSQPPGCSSKILEKSSTTSAPSLDDGMNSSGVLSQTRTSCADGDPPSMQNLTSIFQSLISRTRKTVRGSAGDIGWLQCAPGVPPVEDGTRRFMELLDNVRNGEHRLTNSLVYLLVPGLFSNHGPLYFTSTKISFSRMGLTCHIAKIHSEASVEKNARELKEYIEEIYWGSKKRVLLLGHSKGGVDAAAAVARYWSELNDKVAGIALAQSPFGGSPIVSDILREGQLGDYIGIKQLTEILICRVIKGEMLALEDLTYERRKEFLSKYKIPPELPVVSFHTEAGISPAVISTLAQVAYAELPVVSTLGCNQVAKVPVVVPLAAAMAASAQLLQVRYGEKSDGLVTCRDAEVPGSVVVHPERKLDHAWMVYSSLNDDLNDANPAQVCEALLTLLVEVGQKKRRNITRKDD